MPEIQASFLHPLSYSSLRIRRTLSGPVLRDAARLSQRYPPIARYGVFGVVIPPPPFLRNSPLESMRSGGAIPPPQKGYLSDTCAIPYENKANGCDTPLCDTISKGYCAIWGGISHWAAKGGHNSGERFLLHLGPCKSPNPFCQPLLAPQIPSSCCERGNRALVIVF